MNATDGTSRNTTMRPLAWMVIAVLPLLVAGCGETDALSRAKLYPVKGKVVLADGKPLTSGSVVFVATKSTITGTAKLEPDGGFTFKGSAGDGLPEGDYRVRIESAEATKLRGNKAALPFASVYLDEDLSKLTATVTPDESKNNFEFKLDAKDSQTNAGSSRGHGDR